jgi:hypothetical protein
MGGDEGRLMASEDEVLLYAATASRPIETWTTTASGVQ